MIVRRTLQQIQRSGGGAVDRKRLAATTDSDIRRQIASDPDTAPDLETLPPPRVMAKSVRLRLGLTQAQMAKSLRISVATLRNWEQGRTRPEGPAEALLVALDRAPKAVLRALARQ
jgi:putative transcriptional regulator